MTRSAILVAAMMLSAAALQAQESSEEPKFSIKPTGRILMDGAAYFGGNGDHSDIAEGVANSPQAPQSLTCVSV